MQPRPWKGGFAAPPASRRARPGRATQRPRRRRTARASRWHSLRDPSAHRGALLQRRPAATSGGWRRRRPVDGSTGGLCSLCSNTPVRGSIQRRAPEDAQRDRHRSARRRGRAPSIALAVVAVVDRRAGRPAASRRTGVLGRRAAASGTVDRGLTRAALRRGGRGGGRRPCATTASSRYFVGGGVAAFDCDDDGRPTCTSPAAPSRRRCSATGAPVGGALAFEPACPIRRPT